MTKADIVNEISKSTGIDKANVLDTVEKFMEIVKDSLIQGENVYLRGFGSFIIKVRSEKTARNISRNTTIVIPEHRIPAFKPAKVFMEDVKNAVFPEIMDVDPLEEEVEAVEGLIEDAAKE